MNLYIISEVLYDYTDGMVVIAAESLDRARALFQDKWSSARLLQEFDAAIGGAAYKVLQVQDQAEGIVSYVFGGG
jgi:hypothetical protein